jgi:hypothetical protein
MVRPFTTSELPYATPDESVTIPPEQVRAAGLRPALQPPALVPAAVPARVAAVAAVPVGVPAVPVGVPAAPVAEEPVPPVFSPAPELPQEEPAVSRAAPDDAALPSPGSSRPNGSVGGSSSPSPSSSTSRSGGKSPVTGSAAGAGGAGATPASAASVKPIRLAKPRPMAVAVLAGFTVTVALGCLAGLLRFSVPVPIVFGALAGAAVGSTMAFAGGGRSAGLRWGVLAQAVTMGCAAPLLALIVQYSIVKSKLTDWVVRKMEIIAGERRERLEDEMTRRFSLGQFIAFREAAAGDELDRAVNEFGENLLQGIGGKSFGEFWQQRQYEKLRQTFGSSDEELKAWTCGSLRARFESPRFRGGGLEPRGRAFRMVWGIEILLAGALAALIYVQATAQPAEAAPAARMVSSRMTDGDHN